MTLLNTLPTVCCIHLYMCHCCVVFCASVPTSVMVLDPGSPHVNTGLMYIVTITSKKILHTNTDHENMIIFF